MRLIRATAAPLPIVAGNRLILISPPSIRGFGLIFNFLRSVIEPPPRPHPEWSPVLGDPASIAALTSDLGLNVLGYVVMERDNPELRIADVADLVAAASIRDRRAIADMALYRTRMDDPDGLDHWKMAGGGRGVPINELNLGKLLERADFRRFPPDTVARWSLDQLENKLSGGASGWDADGVAMTKQEEATWFLRMADPKYREIIRQKRIEQDRREAERRANQKENGTE